MPKNVNPSSSIDAKPLSNSTTPVGSDISKSELKDSSKSSIDKEKKSAKTSARSRARRKKNAVLRIEHDFITLRV